MKLEKTRSPSHTIIGAIHPSSVIHVALKKPLPRKEKPSKPLASKKERSKKRKLAMGKDQKNSGIVIEEPVVEYVEVGNKQDDGESNKPPPKGTTTAHFIKFMNELLDIMDSDEILKGSYFVMDNCTIRKSHPMIRKIEGRGYKVMYLPPYSLELNAIENFWAVVKGKMKRENLMTEETLSQKSADVCNNVRVSDLRAFCSHSKRHISFCRDKIHF